MEDAVARNGGVAVERLAGQVVGGETGAQLARPLIDRNNGWIRIKQMRRSLLISHALNGEIQQGIRREGVVERQRDERVVGTRGAALLGDERGEGVRAAARD